LIFLSLSLSFVWFISCLAETNRTAFDFAEGESELVSGFNVEYGGGGFSLIFFLDEYASVIFIGLLFCIVFLGSDLYSFLFYINPSKPNGNSSGRTAPLTSRRCI
jgi:NADH-ubiquinone oxidoreductase chain 1